MGYIRVITYNLLTNHLLTSWDIQVGWLATTVETVKASKNIRPSKFATAAVNASALLMYLRAIFSREKKSNIKPPEGRKN